MAVAFREAMSEEYHQYAGQIVQNAKTLAEYLKAEGFRLMGGRTENHLLLFDIVHSEKGLAAKDGHWLSIRWERAGIVANKNAVPGDAKPWYPSGIRIGTPAVTTLGMKEEEMRQIGDWIIRATRGADNDAELERIRTEITLMMERFTPEQFV